jgi:AcrR family transcriptional regulator
MIDALDKLNTVKYSWRMAADVPKTRAERLRAGSQARRARTRTETRRAILDAAVTLFLEHGYEHFSLRQVAEAIGYSPTTIYLYFKDKDDLLFHAARDGFRVFGDRMEAAYQAGGDAQERLRLLGRAYVRFGLEYPVHYRLMFMQRAEFLNRPPPDGDEPVIDSFGVLRRTVVEGLAEGVFKASDPDLLSAFIWSGVHGIVALAITTDYFPEETVRALQEQLERTLREGVMT